MRTALATVGQLAVAAAVAVGVSVVALIAIVWLARPKLAPQGPGAAGGGAH